VRAFRLLALGALAVSATACTLWFALDHPYDGLGAEGGADASPDLDVQPSEGGPADASDIPPLRIPSNVSALAVYGDTLYANGLGQVYVYDEDAGTLDLLVAHDASTNEFKGIAVDDAGIFWTADDGIWFANLNGGGVPPSPPISDPNNPQVLAADGPRLSWTTNSDAGIVIHSCKNARIANGCRFATIGGPSPIGDGGPSELVGADADVDPGTLGAGLGYVAWVSTQTNDVEITSVTNNATSAIAPANDKTFNNNSSDNTWVGNDGPTIFWSFQNGTTNQLIVRRGNGAGDTTGTVVMSMPKGAPKSFCFAATAGSAVVCPLKATAVLVDAYDASAQQTIDLGDAGTPIAVAATSKWLFVIDSQYALWRFARN